MSHTTSDAGSRTLPESLSIPIIDGEMVHLRPAVLEDLPTLDMIDAYHNSSLITGRPEAVERAVVHEWVQNSVLWSSTNQQVMSELRQKLSFKHVVAWTMETKTDDAEESLSSDRSSIIGMIFLVNVSGWAKSARMHVVLGKNFRGRGYSRDAMPRILTYAFASRPVGLDLYRIWVAIPEQNTRTHSVYTSLGFVHEGVSRKAIWNNEQQKYDDLHVFGILADEYDPIHSLDAFGMHLIMENPGVKEALPDVQCDSQCGDRTLETVNQLSQKMSAAAAHQTQNSNIAHDNINETLPFETVETLQEHVDVYDMMLPDHAEEIAEMEHQKDRQKILNNLLDNEKEKVDQETIGITSQMHSLGDTMSQDTDATVWPYQHIDDVNMPQSDDSTITRSPKRAWWRLMGEKRQRTSDRTTKKDK